MKPGIARWIAVAGSIGLIAAALLTTANAHIGASHAPFATNGPDLRSASFHDGKARVCFDETVQTPAASDFAIRGYDSDTRSVGDSASLDQVDPKCVLVSFNDDRDVDQFTIVIAAAGAVENGSGKENIEASAAIDESAVESGPGFTDAPNLKRNFKIESILYELDEGIDCDSMGAGAFGYYKDDGEGTEAYGTGVKDCDDDEAAINFGADVEDIARVFVDPPSGSEPCAPEPSGACIGFESEGEETADPDLEQVERDNEDVTFRFDEEVTGDPDESLFQVVAEDGTKYAPDADSCDVDNEEVTCEFPDIEDAAEGDVVLAGVGDCAVMADSDAECNTIGDAALADSGHAPGFSDGPDLESCSLNESGGTATLIFDEPVDAGSGQSTRLQLFDVEGSMSSATDVGSATGNSLEVSFAADAIDGAVGCHASFDAVSDFLDNQSPEASVGIATEEPTTGPSTPPPPSIDTVKTTLSMRFDRNDHVFRGTAKSGRARCKRGRKVVVKKDRVGTDTTVGSDTTDAAGNWGVRKAGAKGPYYASVKEKRYTTEGNLTVICKKDRSDVVRVGGTR